jgi:NACalpha-BTF3-like transcription factor
VDVDDDAGSDAGSSVLSAVSDLEGDVADGEIETNDERGRDRRSSAIKGRRDFGANGFEPEDVELVMTRAGVSRGKAIDALKANDGDAVSAIMDLTM